MSRLKYAFKGLVLPIQITQYEFRIFTGIPLRKFANFQKSKKYCAYNI